MSCRSLPSTSAATTFARLNCSLNDAQTVSVFHALRAEVPADAPAPDVTEYRAWLDAERNLIDWHPNLTEARKASLLRRLDAARAGSVVDGRTWSALQRLRPATQAASNEVDRQLERFSQRMGVRPERVRALFDKYAAEESGPEPGSMPGYAAVHGELTDRRMPRDRGTTRAIQRLEAAARAAEAARPRSQDALRVHRQPMNSSSIAEAGYDPEVGRLEVTFHGQPGRVYAYRGVPPRVWEAMQSGSAGAVFSQQVRNHRQYRYPSGEAAAADRYRQQCRDCGQFYGAGHTCPTRSLTPTAPSPVGTVVTREDVARLTGAPQPTPPAGRSAHRGTSPRRLDPGDMQRVVDPETGAVLSLPSQQRLLNEITHGPVAVHVSHFNTGDPNSTAPGLFRVWGLAVYDYADADGDEVAVNTVGLRCSCRKYARNHRCEHIDGYHVGLLRHVNAQQASVEQVRRAATRAQEELAANWAARPEVADVARGRFAAGEMDPQVFLAEADAAKAAMAAGQDPLGYVTVNATGGLLTPESGRGFGIEFEYDFPPEWTDEQRAEANAAIASDLWREGLIPTPRQQQYHAAAEASGGYATQHEYGWSFEEDATVAGEIVSPVMHDTEETWRNVATVCDIVKRHGGIASKSTGSHVHISAPEIGANVGAATELARMHVAYEDVLFRLASNPAHPDGKHRGTTYCQPSPEVPLAGYQSAATARTELSGHSNMLNLAGVTGRASDHAEFRAWDGTLNPSVIQAQVKMSAAMAVAASRNAAQTAPIPREDLGSHTRRAAAGEASDAVADSASARMFADTLFSRDEDKAMVARLFGVTRWQS